MRSSPRRAFGRAASSRRRGGYRKFGPAVFSQPQPNRHQNVWVSIHTRPREIVAMLGEGEMAALPGHRVRVFGIANDQSIASGCAREFRAQGSDHSMTRLNAKAGSHVRPLADVLGAEISMPLDVTARPAISRWSRTWARWRRSTHHSRRETSPAAPTKSTAGIPSPLHGESA